MIEVFMYKFLLSNLYIRNTEILPRTNLEHEIENNLIQFKKDLLDHFHLIFFSVFQIISGNSSQ